jgi:alpha-glucosidase
MPRARFVRATALFSCLLAAAAQTPTASSSGWSTTLNGTPTSFRSVFTIPPSADTGADLIANIKDPEAVNAQDVCPGYKAAQLQKDAGGLSAVLTLAGKPCNVYGNDVEVLNLKVEYQAQSRLAVNISPAYIVSIFGTAVWWTSLIYE